MVLIIQPAVRVGEPLNFFWRWIPIQTIRMEVGVWLLSVSDILQMTIED